MPIRLLYAHPVLPMGVGESKHSAVICQFENRKLHAIYLRTMELMMVARLHSTYRYHKSGRRKCILDIRLTIKALVHTEFNFSTRKIA